jgi:adenylate kinase
MLSQAEDIVHISTGDIFRNEIKNETELGKKAKEYVTSGGLVPDDLVAEMVGSRIAQSDCDNGFILDGFPRTLNQAHLFEDTLKKIGRTLDLVIYFEAGEELLLKRLTARIICRDCGTSFNKIFSPPKKEGICDKCGGELYQRPDDSLETAKNRLELYDKETAPLIDYYKEKGILVSVNGETNRDVTFSELMGVLS